MDCKCKINLPGQSYSYLDHEQGVVRGYVRCPCSKREKLIYEMAYRPKPKKS